MATWFGLGQSRKQKTPPPESAFRVQTSVYGTCRAIGWGQQRMGWNLIWYGDFKSIAHQQGGGKGGLVAGGKSGGKGGGVTYTYEAAVAGGICEGPVDLVGTCWDSDGSQFQLGSKNLVAFNGTYSQAPWSYLTSKHSSQADNYRGLCYTAAGPMQLGASPVLPNITFEIKFAISDAYPGIIDANPKEILVDFLTNPYYGLLFPADRIGDLTVWEDYCYAMGLFLSPVLTTQQAASQFVQDLMEMTNSEVVWSGGLLKVVPYGDQTITANGHTYTPPQQALYSLGDDELMPSQGSPTSSSASSSSSDPIIITRKPTSQTYNIIKVEYIYRLNNYNPQVVEAKDEADIAQTGERPADVKSLHGICRTDVAQNVAQLLLGRQQYRNELAITVGPEYMLLEPMDIIELVSEALGMDNQWVRIKEITRNADGSYIFQCEEYLYGTGSTPLYGTEAGDGYNANTEVDPGDVSPPILINPPAQLVQGRLEVWVAVSGVNPMWGGCEVHVSFDGSSYQKIGSISGASRYGELLANYPSHSDPDNVDSLVVDLSASLGQLASGSPEDYAALTTLAMIDDEYIAYQNVTVDSTYSFTITPSIRRGLYGTTIAAHTTGAPFVRLDNRIFHIPYESGQQGSTIYVKFASFNIYGGGIQDISTLTPYTINIDQNGDFFFPQPIADGTVLFDQTVAGSWSYPIPDGTPFVEIQLWGAGGAGGNSSGTSKGGVTPGYGAGGGAYVAYKLAAVSGTSLSGTVGKGGQSGGNGTATTSSSPSLSAAYGTAAVGTTSVGVGGTASGGNVTNTNGRNGGLTNGWDGGGAGNGGGDQTANGNPGTLPGGGGAGGYYSSPGAGADGRVRVVARSS